MLPKEKRLKASDFKGTKPKLVYRGVFFDVSVSAKTETTKFGCIIAKKRIKRAVDRTRARRKMYTLLQKITTKTPLLVFVYPTQALITAPQTTLHEEVSKAFATL